MRVTLSLSWHVRPFFLYAFTTVVMNYFLPASHAIIHDQSRLQVHTHLKFNFQFGESQKLRLVRILRSTVMVRVGGGWQALDEFLVKNDPCRGNSSKH